MALVYIHRRLDNKDIFYIGIGKNESRINSKRNRNKYWGNIVNKYGYESYIFINNITWAQACNLERYLINFYGRKDLGNGNLVNMTDGGDGNNNIIISENTRLKLSANNNKYWLGKSHSKETKDKISKNRKGKIISIESKKKQSESIKLAHKNGKYKSLIGRIPWNKGVSPSKETLEKQRIKKIGIKRKPHSEETKEKMRLKALLREERKRDCNG